MKKQVTIVALIFAVITFSVLYFFLPGFLYDLVFALHRPLAGVKSKTVNVDNYSIAYVEGGKGETVLFLHGYSTSKDMWLLLARKLKPYYHVLAIDLPGFGESSKIKSESYNITNQSIRLSKIMDALDLEKVHLAGASMGGAIAAKFASDNPEKIKSLALFDSAGIYSNAERSEFLNLLLEGDNLFIVENSRDIKRLFDFLYEKPPWSPLLFQVHVLMGKENIKLKEINEKIIKELYEERYSLEDELEKIQAKTVIYWGEKDRILDVSCAKIINDKIKNSQLIIFKNCGHLPMIERANETAKSYIDFLKSIPQ